MGYTLHPVNRKAGLDDYDLPGLSWAGICRLLEQLGHDTKFTDAQDCRAVDESTCCAWAEALEKAIPEMVYIEEKVRGFQDGIRDSIQVREAVDTSALVPGYKMRPLSGHPRAFIDETVTFLRGCGGFTFW